MERKTQVVLLAGVLICASGLGLPSVKAATLLHHWTLDETSGSTVADSAGNNNGTINNTDGVDLTVAGQAGSAADFTGSFIAVSGVFSGNEPRAISVWFNSREFSSIQPRMFGIGVPAAAQSFDLTTEVSGGNNSVWLRYGNGNMTWSGAAELGQALQTNTWYHLVFQYDGTTLVADTAVQCWINGVQLSRDGGNNNNSGQTLITGASDMYIGAKIPTEPRPFNGLMDDIQLYDGPLAADEIAFLFNNPGATLSFEARNPSPGNGTIGVSTSTDLQWDGGLDPQNFGQRNPDITEFFVYLDETNPGEEPNFVAVSPVTVADPGTDPVTLANASLPLTLSVDKAYHWRVDTGVNNSGPSDPNTIVGKVWSFEAVKSVPVVTGDPERTAAFFGESTSFTCLFTSVSTVTADEVSWTRNGNAAPGSAVLTDLGSGSYRSVLTIPSVVDTDAGDYICTIRTTDSASAELLVKRKLAHWEFEGDFSDSLGNFGLSVLDPNNGVPQFVTGLVGSAIDCNGVADGLVYEFAEEEEFFAGYTVSLWTQTAVPNQAQFTSAFSTQSTTSAGFQMDFNNSNEWRYWDGSGTVFGLVEPTWVLLTVAADPDNNTTIYYNGLNSGTDAQIQPFVDGFSFALNRGQNIFYNGQIDDAMFWNYPLSQAEVAQVYFDVSGQAVCDPTLQSIYDVTGPSGVPDCHVNILDFVPFAAAWLDCSLLPGSQCSN